MAELRKRMNAGWVLMDAIVNAEKDCIDYYLERGRFRCVVRIESNGIGRVLK